MMKYRKCKSEDEWMKLYGENIMILHMVEYCEVINPESIETKTI